MQEKAADPLIDTYEAERRPLATEVLRGTSAVTRVNVARNPVCRFLRDHVAPRIFSPAPVQRWITYTASQLWVSYRKGPLGGRDAKPRPGQPDPGHGLSPGRRHGLDAAPRTGRAMGAAASRRGAANAAAPAWPAITSASSSGS